MHEQRERDSLQRADVENRHSHPKTNIQQTLHLVLNRMSTSPSINTICPTNTYRYGRAVFCFWIKSTIRILNQLSTFDKHRHHLRRIGSLQLLRPVQLDSLMLGIKLLSERQNISLLMCAIKYLQEFKLKNCTYLQYNCKTCKSNTLTFRSCTVFSVPICVIYLLGSFDVHAQMKL